MFVCFALMASTQELMACLFAPLILFLIWILTVFISVSLHMAHWITLDFPHCSLFMQIRAGLLSSPTWNLKTLRGNFPLILLSACTARWKLFAELYRVSGSWMFVYGNLICMCAPSLFLIFCNILSARNPQKNVPTSHSALFSTCDFHLGFTDCCLEFNFRQKSFFMEQYVSFLFSSIAAVTI